MFKSKAKSKAKSKDTTTTVSVSTSTSEQLCNIIAAGTRIEGTFKSTEDLRFDGKVIGDINCQKKFVMGDAGRVDGTVSCAESSIRGKIDGTLKVKGLLHLLSTAVLKGKIMASKMVVDEGASYSGECLIGDQHVK